MKSLLFAIKHKLVVQFRHKPQKIEMNKQSNLVLDGSEKSMIPIIRNNTDKLSFGVSKKKMIALEEFSAGTGISDLTVFTVDDRLLAGRKKSDKRPVTSKNHIQVLLALLSHDGLTVAEIMTQVQFASKSTVQRILEQLMEGNLVHKEGVRYRAAYSLLENTSQNIIAIEAKVRDWKSGIRQAMRYKEYADYSYLAIYEDNIASCLNNIQTFEMLGIGLIGVSDEGVTVHLRAAPSNMIALENKVLAFERFISVIDERYETFVAGNGFVAKNV